MEVVDLTKDFVKPEGKKPKKERLKLLFFKEDVLARALVALLKAKPKEEVRWFTGRVENGIGIIEECFESELEYSTPVSVRTEPKWLLSFIENLGKDRNLVVAIHSHPLGSALSSIDKGTLLALNDWLPELCWCTIACDLSLGAYTVHQNEIVKVDWEVDKEWKEKKEEKKEIEIIRKTPSITSRFSWAKRLLEKLRKLKSLL